MQDEFLDVLRNPFIIFVTLSSLFSLCVVSSSTVGEAVELEFPAYRMTQHELNGVSYGSKQAKVQYEAVSLDGAALRRCVVMLWRDVATRDIDHILSYAAGALLIIVPQDVDLLSAADKTLFSDMERRLSSIKSSDLAIYITPTNDKILSILSEISLTTGKSSTATQQLLNTISANTFQFSTTGSSTNTPVTQMSSNVIARLEGSDSSASTIFFIAHYDSHSLFPGYSAGSDSNGSGVVMLLQLLSILKKFYENPATRPAYNLVFAWTAAGKLNYQGTRAFIDLLEKNTAAIIENDRVELAICFEAVGGLGNLHLHASKQPAEGTAAAHLLKRLKLAAPNGSVELVTKKINLNAPQLNWEHERFNIRRLPAVTISRYPTSDDPRRNSVLDTPAQINIDTLERNIRTVAEALLGYILALPEVGSSVDPHVTSTSSILSRDAIDRHLLTHFIRQFASKPRPAADYLATKSMSANIAATVRSLVKTVTVEPVMLIDAQVYGVTTDKLLAEKVKPAVFELFISGFIVLFLTVVYQLVIRAQNAVEGAVSCLRKRV